MKININIINESKEDKDYQQLVCDKLTDLGCFITWKKSQDERVIMNYSWVKNDEMFVRCGIIQSLIIGLGSFGGDNNILSLILLTGVAWEDIYNKIKDIDKIEWEIKE